MARPRSFDTQAVLDAAGAEFRVHGFADTSTEQLCEAAGVRRSSLYNTFTSKEELFVQALQRYTEVMMGRQAGVLTDPELSGGSRLRGLMEIIVDEECAAQEQGHAAGCMVVHSFMSPDVRERDERVQAILDRDLNHRLSLLKQAAMVGQLDGSVRTEVSPDAVALLISTVISGLRVTAHTGVTREQLLTTAEASLGAVLT